MDVNLDEIDLLDFPKSSKKSVAATYPKVGFSKPRIFEEEKIHFFASFSRLLRGGVPILKAMDLAAKQIRSERFSGALLEIRKYLQEGESLTSAFTKFPAIFKQYEISMIKAGEISGTVSDCLSRLSDELKQQKEIKSKVKEAIVYPSFVLLMGITTLFVILIFVIPRLSLIYKDFHGELPLATKIVMGTSSVAPYLLTVLILIIGVIWVWLRKNPDRGWSFLEKAPLFNDLFKKLYVSRMALLLSTLTRSGIPMREAIQVLMESFPLKRKEIGRLLADISQGNSLSKSFQHLDFFGDHERSLLLAGEESGTVAECFAEIAQAASEDLSSKIRFVLKILEPLLILVIGLIVGFIVASMILPIAEIDLLAGD